MASFDIQLSEQLARRIRRALGKYDDPTEPVQSLVESVVRKLEFHEALKVINGRQISKKEAENT